MVYLVQASGSYSFPVVVFRSLANYLPGCINKTAQAISANADFLIIRHRITKIPRLENMKKIQKHIEIVRSSKPWLSSLSMESCGPLLELLSKNYQTVSVSNINSLEDLQELVAKKPDLVFLGMKFIPQEVSDTPYDAPKIWISNYLDQHDIPHTGSEHTAHELELNKQLAKQRVQAAGLSTSPFRVVNRTDNSSFTEINLTYPVFIKPTNRGGGLGIDSDSVAHNFSEAQAKIKSIAARHNSDSLIEEYLPGREFSVAVLKDETTQEYVAMPIELIAQPDTHGVRVLSEQVKSANAETAIVIHDPVIKKIVTTLALDVFQALGARDYGRIDIRMDEMDSPHFLEANLIPSLIAGYGSFPKACALNAGINYEQMILTIVRLGMARANPEDAIKDSLEPYGSLDFKQLLELA